MFLFDSEYFEQGKGDTIMYIIFIIKKQNYTISNPIVFFDKIHS